MMDAPDAPPQSPEVVTNFWSLFDRSQPFWAPPGTITAGLVIFIIVCDVYCNVVLRWSPPALDQMAMGAFTAYVVGRATAQANTPPPKP